MEEWTSRHFRCTGTRGASNSTCQNDPSTLARVQAGCEKYLPCRATYLARKPTLRLSSRLLSFFAKHALVLPEPARLRRRTNCWLANSLHKTGAKAFVCPAPTAPPGCEKEAVRTALFAATRSHKTLCLPEPDWGCTRATSPIGNPLCWGITN